MIISGASRFYIDQPVLRVYEAPAFFECSVMLVKP